MIRCNRQLTGNIDFQSNVQLFALLGHGCFRVEV